MIRIPGERIVLRDHIPDDLDDMHEWISDRHVMKYVPYMISSSKEETDRRLHEIISEIQNTTRVCYFFAIVLDDKVIGDAGFTIIGREDREEIADMGFFLRHDFQGKGYGSESAGLILKYCFETRNIQKVTAGCDADNISSERVMMKIGMKKEREYYRLDSVSGIGRKRVEYGITRDDYKIPGS